MVLNHKEFYLQIEMLFVDMMPIDKIEILLYKLLTKISTAKT